MKTGKIVFSLIFLLTLLICYSGCRKNVSKLPARVKVDKVSLCFGNDITEGKFTISNLGEKDLTYTIVEDMPWMKLSKTEGTLGKRVSEDITVTVNRDGLVKNHYEGPVQIFTNDKNNTLVIYLDVDMFLITVFNPVYTIIHIEAEETAPLKSSESVIRKISPGDSTQFAYFENPEVFMFTAETYGVYTDDSQLGLVMYWNDVYVVPDDKPLRVFLNVSEDYFFLYIINNYQNLSPLYINSGTSFEMVENIIIYQSSVPLPIGYYRALENTIITSLTYDGYNSITWTQGDQFILPFLPNQQVVIENYLSDTMYKSTPVNKFHVPEK